MRNSPKDRADPIRAAQVESHGAAPVFNRAVTATASQNQAFADWTFVLAQLVHPARSHTGTRRTEKFLRHGKFAAFIQRWIHRISRQVCRHRGELQHDVRFERCAIESSKTKVRLGSGRQNGEPITRIGHERCVSRQTVRRDSSHRVVGGLEEHALGAVLKCWNRIGERLETERLANCRSGQEEAIKAQSDTRGRLHEIGHRCAGILRRQRDGRGVSTSVCAEKCRFDEM